MSEQDNLALGAHLNQCAHQRGPLQAAGHAAAWLHTQLAARTLTTLALVALLAVAAWSVF